MVGIDSLQNGLNVAFGEVTEFIKEHPITSAIGVGAGLAAAGGLVALGSVGRKKTKKRSKRGRRKDWRFASKQKHEAAYRRRRKKLGRKSYQKYYKTKSSKKGKVYYARKTGQPYILLASGKAKFIKGKRKK